MRTGGNSFFADVMSTIGNAIATVGALNRGTNPDDARLRALGIDPVEFRKIKRFY